MIDRISSFWFIAALACVASLTTACSTVQPASAMRDGARVASPAGWVDYCRRNTLDKSCNGNATTVAAAFITPSPAAN